MTDKRVADAEFAQQAGQRLRDSEAQITPERLAKLAQARTNAMAQVEAEPQARTRFDGWRVPTIVWVPAGALAATALVVGLMFSNPTEVDPGIDPETIMVAASATEDMELLEDLEFLAWMAESAAELSTDAG